MARGRHHSNAYFLLLKAFPDRDREMTHHEIRAGIDLHYPGGWEQFQLDLDGGTLREFVNTGRNIDGDE